VPGRRRGADLEAPAVDPRAAPSLSRAGRQRPGRQRPGRQRPVRDRACRRTPWRA
jgi:hypothetical protein